MAAHSLMRWSSFTLNPRAPDVEEVTGVHHHDASENGSHAPHSSQLPHSSRLPPSNGLLPAAADLQHELAEEILDVDSDTESQQLVSVPASEADATEGRWDTQHLPSKWFSWRKLWRFTGPGFLMSIAYIVSGMSTENFPLSLDVKIMSAV